MIDKNLENKVNAESKEETKIKSALFVGSMGYATFWAGLASAAYAPTFAEAKDCVTLGGYAAIIGAGYLFGTIADCAVKRMKENKK